MPGHRRRARAAGALPPAGRAGARARAALRAQDRRHAPRDRAADQPLRSLQGVRLDDRYSTSWRSSSCARRSTSPPPRSASLWTLDDEDVALAATAVNENYDVANAPDAVGASVVGDVIAGQENVRRNRIPASDELASENEGFPVQSVLAVPLVEDEVSIGALVLVNKRGRHPEFSGEDEELLADLCAAGGSGPAQRAPARGREEGRGARCAARRQPRDHVHARSRQGDAHDRQRHLGADPLRPLRRSRSSRKAGCGSARCRARRRSTARTRTSGEWKSSCSGSSCPAATRP